MTMDLKEEFLNLLEKDKEFRYAVAGLLGLEEILRRLDRNEQELIRLREDMNKGFKRHDEEIAKLREDMNKGFERHDRELAKLREDMIEGFKRHDEEIAKLREDMNEGFKDLRNQISALGARWGLMAESAFRESLRGILGKELGLKVEQWKRFDSKGEVFGYPSEVEIDVAIRDGKIILVEIKSHASSSDVYTFKRKAEFYERVEGKRPSKLLMVTPYADEKAMEAAAHLDVEIYTEV